MIGDPPPSAVLRVFGLTDEPQHMKGGISQTVWRVGAAVVKPVQEPNPGEGDWVADALDSIEENGFRVAKPVRSESGDWLVDGWTVWRWLEGDHCLHRWRDVTAAARAFHRELPRAVRRAGLASKPAWLDARAHRWAQSERTVWHGAPLPEQAIYDVAEWAPWERARAAGPPLTAEEEDGSQVVHGDVAGNVLAASAVAPVALIDVSPGWRTPESVDAQIVVEAVAWFSGDEALLAEVAPADIARAVAFRLLCGFQALTVGMTFNPDEVARFVRVLDAIGA